MKLDERFNEHRSEDLKTYEHDGTYGASEGCLSVSVCLTCGALVLEASKQKHHTWHGASALGLGGMF